MTLQLSVAARNARLDSFETAAGTAVLFRIYDGSMPATCATAATGTKLMEATLPSDWMANASGGSKAKSGTWEDTAADATGTAGYFRIYDSTGTTCHMQGTCSGTGGGGDLTIDNPALVAGQDVIVTGFTITDGNA